MSKWELNGRVEVGAGWAYQSGRWKVSKWALGGRSKVCSGWDYQLGHFVGVSKWAVDGRIEVGTDLTSFSPSLTPRLARVKAHQLFTR